MPGTAPRPARTGVTVRETIREAMTARETVQPNSRKNSPSTPCIMAMGAKTATMEKVVATTALAISPTPPLEAWLRDSPMARWRLMLSSTTMASSMRIPTTRERASIVRVFSVKPKRCSAGKTARIEAGMATAATTVSRTFPRKKRMDKTARHPPSVRVSRSSLLFFPISTERSMRTVNRGAGDESPMEGASVARRARMPEERVTRLAPDRAKTFSTTAGCPSNRNRIPFFRELFDRAPSEESRTVLPEGSGT